MTSFLNRRIGFLIMSVALFSCQTRKFNTSTDSEQKAIVSNETIGQQTYFKGIWVESIKYQKGTEATQILHCAYFAKTKTIFEKQVKASNIDHFLRAASSSPAGEFVVLEPEGSVLLTPFSGVAFRNTLNENAKKIGKDTLWSALVSQVSLVFQAFEAGATSAKQVLEVRESNESSVVDLSLRNINQRSEHTAQRRDSNEIKKCAVAASASEMTKGCLPSDAAIGDRDLTGSAGKRDAFTLLVSAFMDTKRQPDGYDVRCKNKDEMVAAFKDLKNVGP